MRNIERDRVILKQVDVFSRNCSQNFPKLPKLPKTSQNFSKTINNNLQLTYQQTNKEK